MPPQGPRDAPVRRLTAGVADFIDALRNLGFLGGGVQRDARLIHFVADDGQPIPVRVTGEGPPIVLVHGLGCSHRHWMPVAKRLARAHQVFAWDARGHGQCRPQTGSAITLARLAHDLRQLLDHFQLDRAALVGHSMGALAVLNYVHAYGTSRVATLALVDQSPRIVTDDAWRLGLFGGCSAAMLGGLIQGARIDLADTVLRQVESLAGAWLHPLLGADSALGGWLARWLRRIDAAPLLDLAESLAQADFRPLLPGLDVPLLVVLGARSPHYADLPLGDYYRGAVAHARISVYARAGHSPHCSEPGRFADELERFIAEHRRG